MKRLWDPTMSRILLAISPHPSFAAPLAALAGPLSLASLGPTFARLTILVAFSFAALVAQQDPQSVQAYTFENVTVIPMDSERALTDQTVVVRDGRIAEIGASTSVQADADALLIDGRGRYLTPGLAEMHAVLPSEDDPLRTLVLEETLFLYLANGITTIRVMEGSPYQLDLRRALAEGEIFGPTLYLGSPSSSSDFDADPDALRAMLRAYSEAGYDFLTVDSGLSPALWSGLVEEAQELGISYSGRVPAEIGILQAIEDGISALTHLDGYLEATRLDELSRAAAEVEVLEATDSQKLIALARATAEAGVYLVPAQYLSNHRAGWNRLVGGLAEADSVLALPEFRYITLAQRDAYDIAAGGQWDGRIPEAAAAHAMWRQELLTALAGSGSMILMGTDSPELFNVPGFAVHREIPLMVEAGMSPYEVLQSGTTNVARYVEEYLGQSPDFGTITEGNWADLLLLGENPLESVAALQARVGVMVRGTWLPEAEIQERLGEIANRYRDPQVYGPVLRDGGG